MEIWLDTIDGLIAMHQLRKEELPILGTGILFATQALLASNQGASYISPYFGQIREVGDPNTTLKTIAGLLEANHSPTKILVASLRQLGQIIYCASLGVAAVTLKPDLYQSLMADHPIVEGFTERFLSDWFQAHGPLSLR